MESDDQSVDQAQRILQEWQQFLDVTIHDLRTPLRGIGTSTELLAEVYSERQDDESRRLIRTILDGVAKIDALTKGLASFSRALQVDGLSSVPVRAESALRSALTELEVQIRDSDATIEYDPLPRVRGSHEQLTALFRALLTNALHYRRVEPPKVHITVERETHQWRFAVRDNGVGIDPKYWKQIFRPFQRLRTGNGPLGVGLGLSVCQKIVEAHGGIIWVESQLHAGSTFFFTLPVEMPDVERAGGGGS